MSTNTVDKNDFLEESKKLKSGLGAIAWATLEMMKQGGMPDLEIQKLKDEMGQYFAKPSSDVCNTVLSVVEMRLRDDKVAEGIWYQET